ncbi:AfsR/SARP family transcriptional regulator [Amycolatopsis sp. EV170708-02-1]|uniref:AfsR/SARP family transcriptional regulator n=1 Tax=Amycolatopsis sp. EV170708-02-1 TaxID=2919322 RepID=UPI001F0BDBE7|nr:AfsR/SARP family transcriptional regulator [Amycolatopsis sp. EV170708-02-1]UMP01302.1 AfsR/SARP family transcriptional regulator [Amycolatopsis sp. EV170708-02-1]
MLFQLLGPIEVNAPGHPRLAIKPGKPATVLTALVLERGKWVDVDRLIDAAWYGRTAPASARGNLKSYICGLRRALAPAADRARIESRPGAYRIVVDHNETDIHHVGRNSAEGRDALGDGDYERAAKLLTDALDLWRGTPFEGLRSLDALAEVARLERLHVQIREDLAEASHALGRHLDAISLLHGLIAEDPLREHAWARLVLVLNETGQRSEALATFRRARAIIVRELGVEPGAALTDAHRTVLLGRETGFRAAA